MVEREYVSEPVLLHDDQKVGPFSKSQREILEYVEMGCGSQGDIAAAMRYNKSTISIIKGGLVALYPSLELQWWTRIDAAIEMREGKKAWNEIAEELGYSGPAALYATVKKRIGEDVKTLHKK